MRIAGDLRDGTIGKFDPQSFIKDQDPIIGQFNKGLKHLQSVRVKNHIPLFRFGTGQQAGHFGDLADHMLPFDGHDMNAVNSFDFASVPESVPRIS